jgi:hypothetical protein
MVEQEMCQFATQFAQHFTLLCSTVERTKGLVQAENHHFPLQSTVHQHNVSWK